MEKLVLIGGGGHCKSVIDSIDKNSFSEIVITDENFQSGVEISGYKVVGNDDVLEQLFSDGYQMAFISIGNIKGTEARRRAQERAEAIGFQFPYIIDRFAVVSVNANIHQGVFLGKNSVVNADAKIDKFAIINTGAIIEHESHIGEFAHIAVGATICGGCEIGRDVFVGANSTIIQGVKVGKNSMIGAGSLVLKDVPENSKVIGIWQGTQEFD